MSTADQVGKGEVKIICWGQQWRVEIIYWGQQWRIESL